MQDAPALDLDEAVSAAHEALLTAVVGMLEAECEARRAAEQVHEAHVALLGALAAAAAPPAVSS